MKSIIKIWKKISEIGFGQFITLIIKYPFAGRVNSEYENMLLKATKKERFSEIYNKNFWRSNESGSGRGSEIIYTENLRLWLLRALPKYGVKKFVDAACGDFNWMRMVVPQLDIEYQGFDIVDRVIEQNIAKYSNENIHFAVLDICGDKLPDCDVLMVRDCLFHLSFHDIDNFLTNLSQTNYKFLLTTTHNLKNSDINMDIVSGDFRHIDLFREPFNFKEDDIIERFNDWIEGFTERDMILIEKKNVPKNLN